MRVEPELCQDGVVHRAGLSSQHHFSSSAIGFVMHLKVQEGIIFIHLLFGLEQLAF